MKKNYWITASAALISTLWLTFIKFLAPRTPFFYILNEQGNIESFSQYSISITVVVLLCQVAVFIFTGIRNYREKGIVAQLEKEKNDITKDLEEKKEEYIELENAYSNIVKLLDSINNITEKRMRNYNDGSANPFELTTNPELRVVLEEIVDYFSDITNITKSMIGASLFYRVCQKSGEYTDWRLYPAINVDNALTVEELLNNENTTVRQIIDHKHSSIFLEDKREGIEKNLYVPDPKDIDNDKIGSIICRDISINPNSSRNSYVQAILSITSHGEQFIQTDDRLARTAILTVVLPYYENNIKEILSKMYLYINKS